MLDESTVVITTKTMSFNYIQLQDAEGIECFWQLLDSSEINFRWVFSL